MFNCEECIFEGSEICKKCQEHQEELEFENFFSLEDPDEELEEMHKELLESL